MSEPKYKVNDEVYCLVPNESKGNIFEIYKTKIKSLVKEWDGSNSYIVDINKLEMSIGEKLIHYENPEELLDIHNKMTLLELNKEFLELTELKQKIMRELEFAKQNYQPLLSRVYFDLLFKDVDIIRLDKRTTTYYELSYNDYTIKAPDMIKTPLKVKAEIENKTRYEQFIKHNTMVLKQIQEEMNKTQDSINLYSREVQSKKYIDRPQGLSVNSDPLPEEEIINFLTVGKRFSPEEYDKQCKLVEYMNRTGDNVVLKVLANHHSELKLNRRIIHIIDGLTEKMRHMQDERGNTMLHYILAAKKGSSESLMEDCAFLGINIGKSNNAGLVAAQVAKKDPERYKLYKESIKIFNNLKDGPSPDKDRDTNEFLSTTVKEAVINNKVWLINKLFEDKSCDEIFEMYSKEQILGYINSAEMLQVFVDKGLDFNIHLDKSIYGVILDLDIMDLDELSDMQREDPDGMTYKRFLNMIKECSPWKEELWKLCLKQDESISPK